MLTVIKNQRYEFRHSLFSKLVKKGRCSRVFADEKTIVRWEGHKPTNTTRGHHLWYETTNWTIPPKNARFKFGFAYVFQHPQSMVV